MTPHRSSTSPGARGERLGAAVLWAGLALGALVGILAQPGPLTSSREQPAEGDAVVEPAAPERRTIPTFASAPPAPEPEAAADGAPPAPAPTAAKAMPEGLASDLASFDSTQLRSELASIALSYPEVSIARVACDARPCAAEIDARADAAPALDGYLAALSGRFRGFLTAEYRTFVQEGEARLRAAIVVGGAAPAPPPRHAGGL